MPLYELTANNFRPVAQTSFAELNITERDDLQRLLCPGSRCWATILTFWPRISLGDLRIIWVAQDFALELTTAVLWLRERDIDIRCIRLRPSGDAARSLVARTCSRS